MLCAPVEVKGLMNLWMLDTVAIQWLYDAAFLWMTPLTFHKHILIVILIWNTERDVVSKWKRRIQWLKDGFMCKMWLDVSSTMKSRFFFLLFITWPSTRKPSAEIFQRTVLFFFLDDALQTQQQPNYIIL